MSRDNAVFLLHPYPVQTSAGETLCKIAELRSGAETITRICSGIISRVKMTSAIRLWNFPTNFVIQNDEIYYIDFEWNDYIKEWNFENWSIKYWSQTPEFLRYVKEHS